MANIIYCKNDFNYHVDDIVIVQQPDIDLYHEYIIDKTLPSPFKCYILSPNVKDNEIIILIHYIKYLHSDNIYNLVLNNVNLENELFINYWENLVFSINNLDYALVKKYCSALRDFKIEMLSNKILMLDFIEDFADNVLYPIITKSAFCDFTFSDKQDLWHTITPRCLNYLNKMHDILVSRELLANKLKPLSLYSEQVRRFWNRVSITDKSEKYYLLSIYLFFLAKYNFQNNYFSICLICTHRSLDLYYQSLAIKENIIIERRSSMTYESPISGHEMITLLNTEYQLKQHGILLSDRDRHEFILWLNHTRNLSFLIHNVYDISGIEAKKAIDKIPSIIKDTSWHSKVNLLGSSLRLDKYAIFYVEPSIDTYCSEDPEHFRNIKGLL